MSRSHDVPGDVSRALRNPIANALELYRELSKSGIVTLVLISVLGGFLIAHPFERPLDWMRLLLTLMGILFLASGSSALNQVQERTIDARMPRTAKRPLPSGRMSLRHALIFSTTLIFAGVILLFWLDPVLMGLGVAAVISYNGLYTMWWKPSWAFGAVPGAIPGALPILMGSVAASGDLSSPIGWYLFFLLFFWQMPHFWSLALRYSEDYAQGGIPTLPVAMGAPVTVSHIVLWALAYVGLSFLAPLFIPVGGFYCLSAFAVGAKLLWELRRFVRAPESAPGAAGPGPWLRFFLWINFSLIIYLAVAAADLWSVYLVPLWNG